MNYQIVATLGPSSDHIAVWSDMLTAGVTAFRLNTSHLSLAQLEDWLARLDGFFSGRREYWPVVLDLQGSKWRLGQFIPRALTPGEQVRMVYGQRSRKGALPVPHHDFFQAAGLSGGEIVLNDARVRLALEALGTDWLVARVIEGGEIAPNKGITFTTSSYRKETLSEKDLTILGRTRGLEWTRYAISYVRDALEMAHYRAMLSGKCYLIAKLERRPAVDQAQEIAAAADELWLCRGDLGAELGLPGMAEAVRRFSAQVDALPVPALLAGQVLEHMTAQSIPTRSEVCYLYESLLRGYRGVVLSDETAVGRYPLESCRVAAMFKAKKESQDDPDHRSWDDH